MVFSPSVHVPGMASYIVHNLGLRLDPYIVPTAGNLCPTLDGEPMYL